MYSDSTAETVREQLLALDGVLVVVALAAGRQVWNSHDQNGNVVFEGRSDVVTITDASSYAPCAGLPERGGAISRSQAPRYGIPPMC